MTPQKDNWNSCQLLKISQPNAKNWIFMNLPGIDLYPAGTLGPLGASMKPHRLSVTIHCLRGLVKVKICQF